jgi:hypothetical protein
MPKIAFPALTGSHDSDTCDSGLNDLGILLYIQLGRVATTSQLHFVGYERRVFNVAKYTMIVQKLRCSDI